MASDIPDTAWESRFRRLVEKGALRHGYAFFGSDHAALVRCARSIASFLENGTFSRETGLRETLILSPGNGAIGIDDVRNLQAFLRQRPVFSRHRMVIVERVDCMTDIAQNALLKISEEPPPYARIFLLTPDPEALLPTLRSRFQAIHISAGSCALPETPATDRDAARSFLRASVAQRSRAIREIVEQRGNADRFVTTLIAELSGDMRRHAPLLAFILDVQRRMNETQVNERLQLEAISSRMR